jgi:hypothetical protein
VKSLPEGRYNEVVRFEPSAAQERNPALTNMMDNTDAASRARLALMMGEEEKNPSFK